MQKLAVSNISWSGDDETLLASLGALGVNGLEVAPGKICGGWERVCTKSMSAYRGFCAGYGLSIPAFQAIFFGKPDLQLLGDRCAFSAMCDHVHFVSELAAVAGAKILVFGAPRSRLLLGRPLAEAEHMSVERLGRLAEICSQYEVSLGLEAVPPAYGGEFITSFEDSLRLVSQVRSSGLLLHFDTGCTWRNGDDVGAAIAKAGSLIRHFHIAQPELSDFSAPADYHFSAATTLREVNYQGWLSIEMRENGRGFFCIKEAVFAVRSIYG